MQTEREDPNKEIARRLVELNRWQEEQKKQLNERQNIQRQLLGLEQRNMYKMLGILHPPDDDEQSKSVQALPNCSVLDEKSAHDEPHQDQDQDEAAEDHSPTSHTQKTSGYSTEDPQLPQLEAPNEPTAPTDAVRARRKFLKRGEGLKQRFRIDPDELRLNNLPRYKYANSHSSRTSLRSQRSAQSAKVAKPPKQQSKPTKPTAKTGSAMPKPNLNQTPAEAASPLDAQEKRFQQLLLSSHTACNSTPDAKTNAGSFEAVPAAAVPESKTRTTKAVEGMSASTTPNANRTPISAYSLDSDVLAPITWAKVLDSQQIKPIPVQMVRGASNVEHAPCTPKTDNLMDNLSVFEMLEQKAENGSFDFDSSCIRNFMQRKLAHYQQQQQHNGKNDDIPVSAEMRASRLEPLVCDVLPQNSCTSTSTASGIETDGDDEFYTTDDNEQDTTRGTATSPVVVVSAGGKPRFKVRFIGDRERNGSAVEGSGALMAISDVSSTTLVGGDSTNASSNNGTEIFQQFKEALLTALSNRAERTRADQSGGSVCPVQPALPLPAAAMEAPATASATASSEELQQKAQLVRERLSELEIEIATFKESNVELIRAKQEHELAKAHFTQERIEAMDRLNDERVQMEIYMHDERMKIEEEKRRFEQKMRTMRMQVTTSERKELGRLKQELEDAQSLLKTKEQNHLAAQGRLRAKIRTMEKDQKQLLDDIEALRKENKRLEAENMRISRDQSSKMLTEINRNIAKLAPKLVSSSNDDDDTQTRSRSVPRLSKPYAASKRDASAAAEALTSKTSRQSMVASASTDTKEKAAAAPPAKAQAWAGAVVSGSGDGEVKRTQQEPAYDAEESMADSDSTDDASVLNCHAELVGSKPSEGRSDTAEEYRREIINSDGSKDIWYPNGNLKKISADGMNIRMLYFNKDIKQTNVNEGTVKYYYAANNTWHTTYLDGLEILEFPNGQTEHRHRDGRVEVHFPNNTVKVINPRDEVKLEEWRFADGTNLIQMRNGDRILMFPNGQKEVHTKLNKRREYPDGTMKLVYPDGSQETRYSNGRVRLKDRDGKLIMDTEAVV